MKPWAGDFLSQLEALAKRTGKLNVKAAAELSDVPRLRLYRLRGAPCGDRFREEWDRIRKEAEAKSRKK